MEEPTSRCVDACKPCARCDALLGIEGVRVVAVERDDGRLRVTVETVPRVEGCRRCGVVAVGHGRRERLLHDIPCFGAPVTIIWRKRTYTCPDAGCPGGSFSEDAPALVGPRAKLTTRAIWWVISQLRRDHASIQGLARRLGVDWHTVWDAVRPVLNDLAADEDRFAGVTSLGVDEHVWHHTPHKTKEKGPKEMTGMVDLSRDDNGSVRARLLDLVPGRSGPVYAAWLQQRGEDFAAGVQVATLDPFRGYANAIDAELEDATAVLDAFHVTRLGVDVVDEVRRRVQQDTLGHRGRKNDPLYRIRNVLRAGADRLTVRQWDRITTGLALGDVDDQLAIAWQCYQRLRSIYHLPNLAEARTLAEKLLASLPSCPVPEVARLGRTLRRWKTQFLAYFTTARASNGGTEALNGIIEIHRRIARGFRNPANYRLRMILVGGGLTHPNIR